MDDQPNSKRATFDDSCGASLTWPTLDFKGQYNQVIQTPETHARQGKNRANKFWNNAEMCFFELDHTFISFGLTCTEQWTFTHTIDPDSVHWSAKIYSNCVETACLSFISTKHILLTSAFTPNLLVPCTLCRVASCWLLFTSNVREKFQCWISAD